MEDYDYALPEGRIARYPAAVRDESRLLVVHRDGSPLEHARFRDIVRLFSPGDVLVVNESRVLPARLLGRKPTGAPSEVLLIRPAASASHDAKLWEALVRPGGKLKPGRRVVVSDELAVEIVDSTEGGGRIVRLDTPLSTADALERYGHVPLPPYLEREDEPLDRERYQTVYARVPGSVAAPTAGLHFTRDLLDRLAARGVEVHGLRLDVGPATFRPIAVPRVDDAHALESEPIAIPAETAAAIARAKADGRRVVAVGTTTTRALESAAGDGGVRAGAGDAGLFIRPPFRFRVVDALVTNFHLPRSTLLMLVSAFADRELILAAYAHAIAAGYRFYSFGDAMLIE